jgi:hypothetical protein
MFVQHSRPLACKDFVNNYTNIFMGSIPTRVAVCDTSILVSHTASHINNTPSHTHRPPL